MKYKCLDEQLKVGKYYVNTVLTLGNKCHVCSLSFFNFIFYILFLFILFLILYILNLTERTARTTGNIRRYGDTQATDGTSPCFSSGCLLACDYLVLY